MSDKIAVFQALDLVSFELKNSLNLLERAREELRLIRMKDCGAVYDPMLRIELDMMLTGKIEPDSMKAREEGEAA